MNFIGYCVDKFYVIIIDMVGKVVMDVLFCDNGCKVLKFVFDLIVGVWF